MTEIELSPLDLADADAHLAGEDEELIRWLSGGRSTPATVEAYLRRCVQQWHDGGPVLAFGIRVADPPQLVGTIEIQFDQPYLQPARSTSPTGCIRPGEDKASPARPSTSPARLPRPTARDRP